MLDVFHLHWEALRITNLFIHCHGFIHWVFYKATKICCLKTLKGDYHLALQQCLVLGHLLKAKKIFAFKNGFDQCMPYACVDTTSDTVHTYIKLVPVSKNKNHHFHRPKKVPRFGSPAWHSLLRIFQF